MWSHYYTMTLHLQRTKWRLLEVKAHAQGDPARKRQGLNLTLDLSDSEASAEVCLTHVWTGDHAYTCSDTHTPLPEYTHASVHLYAVHTLRGPCTDT